MPPFPNAPLYARLESEGRLLREDAWDYGTLFDINDQPKGMSGGGGSSNARVSCASSTASPPTDPPAPQTPARPKNRAPPRSRTPWTAAAFPSLPA